jgi:hypothetical protein
MPVREGEKGIFFEAKLRRSWGTGGIGGKLGGMGRF